jgi:hypothetical protein
VNPEGAARINEAIPAPAFRRYAWDAAREEILGAEVTDLRAEVASLSALVVKAERERDNARQARRHGPGTDPAGAAEAARHPKRGKAHLLVVTDPIWTRCHRYAGEMERVPAELPAPEDRCRLCFRETTP